MLKFIISFYALSGECGATFIEAETEAEARALLDDTRVGAEPDITIYKVEEV